MSPCYLPVLSRAKQLHAILPAIFLAAMPARAGHEVSYYPSFYPQEIRIEVLDAREAAHQFDNRTDPLHAYLDGPVDFVGNVPSHVAFVRSLQSFKIVSASQPDRDARCRAVTRIAANHAGFVTLDGRVGHPYPVTRYHADYLGHADHNNLAEVTVVGPLGEGLTHEDVPVSTVLRRAGAGSPLWPGPPWVKDGWFQAYHLLRPAVGDASVGARADALYARLTRGELKDATERLKLERELVAALTHGCERAVIGYRVRHEFYNDDFSGGIENILADSQFGFNTPMFVRTVKLKDFPWNGWLRIGIGESPRAAWNPVAGFTDAIGRLVWSIAADPALLTAPHNSRWVQNRVERLPEDGTLPQQSIAIPADAVAPQAGTGRLEPVAPGASAMSKVSYRVLASPFHDGSPMETADLLYPYVLALRWGTPDANGKVPDAEIAAATQLMRDRFKGVRIVRIEEKTLQLADLTFTYRFPIVEVYLDNPFPDRDDNTLIAPPWSPVPWHLLALMEAGAERGIGVFSQTEAERSRVPWLDLVNDAAQRAGLRALIKSFAQNGYRPAALEKLVAPEAAKARWAALDAFVEANGHLLVTNGPYRLKTVSPKALVFDVVREFTYPIGLGTFDAHAYPPRASIAAVVHDGNRLLISADVETAVKQQRSRRSVRVPLRRDTLRETFPIQTVSRTIIVGRDGLAAAVGTASWTADGRLAVDLPPDLPSGDYTAFTALFLDGNTVTPTIGRVNFKHP